MWMLFNVLWCKYLDTWFLVHFTMNIFIFNFELSQAKLHFSQKWEENAITWCILVIVTTLFSIPWVISWTNTVYEYLEPTLEGYENTRPVFPVFRTRVHGCSGAELCCGSDPETLRRYRFFWQLSHARQVTYEFLRISWGGVCSNKGSAIGVLRMSLPRWKWKQLAIHWWLLLRKKKKGKKKKKKVPVERHFCPECGKSYLQKRNLVRHRKQYRKLDNGHRFSCSVVIRNLPCLMRSSFSFEKIFHWQLP